MLRAAVCFLLCLFSTISNAQSGKKPRNYPSLLWEITGPGLSKPSYLFGTMHVSNKLAFHLADSFYIGIRKADVVALETNPESWQEDMNNYASDVQTGSMYSLDEAPRQFLSINTLRFFKYDNKLEAALASSPSTINNLLYRSYGESGDFEEDTYLDMYIYQCGKKWGKKIAGVENYARSMQLMAEAYRDAERDPLRKSYRNNDVEDYYSSGKLQDAYRSGNLDWLDSINKLNSFSPAFDEKFMYLRNDIQAASIDSILRTGQSLFVGVGAAHLPGHRGVIEWLRNKGYRLRPVKMGARDSQHKNQVEKLRVPIVFQTQTSADGFYKVDIPGKLYQFEGNASMDQRQYADMANGSYYMVSRIMTNAWMWNHSRDRVHEIIDSLLYENIPGKIITRTAITKNGYKGFDITNRTRRGDLQRYNVFVTPFEIILFKMSGTADYVAGQEAQRYFGSIQLKEYTAPATTSKWVKFVPSGGGFAIDMPHQPFVGNDGSWIFDAEDKAAGTHYRVIRTDIHNYQFAEEDSFDLGLLHESFASSDFIDTQLTRTQTKIHGYAALDATFRDKAGYLYTTRFIIQGPHYYTIVAHGKTETRAMRQFINSFRIESLKYGASTLRTDTALKFTVLSPVFPKEKKIRIEDPGTNYGVDDELMQEMRKSMGSMVIENDTTGEKLHLAAVKVPKYLQVSDSLTLTMYGESMIDTLSIVRYRKDTVHGNGMRVIEVKSSDTLSSRLVWAKSYIQENHVYQLTTMLDTLTAPSSFLLDFYNTFKPVPVLTGASLFSKKTKLFFDDFLSADTVLHKRAKMGLSMVTLDSADLPLLKSAIGSVSWNTKGYMSLKKQLISKLSEINTDQAADYGRDLFFAAGDTLELQLVALEALARIKTQHAYREFKNLLISETPVIQDVYSLGGAVLPYSNFAGDLYPANSSFTDELHDSLLLTRTIIRDILPLINLDEYEQTIKNLLVVMIDSNMIKPKEYEAYFNRFLIEAKQEVRKYNAMLKQADIAKATKAQNKKGDDDDDDYSPLSDRYANDARIDHLITYAKLLIPFWKKEAEVPKLLAQMSVIPDDQLKLKMLLLMIRLDKPYADTLIQYFAGKPEFRSRLHSDLHYMDKLYLFPARYGGQLDFAVSTLRAASVSTEDSLVFLDRIATVIRKDSGYVYFFKVKPKGSTTWKLATSGLYPLDTTKVMFPVNEEFRRERPDAPKWYYSSVAQGARYTKFKPDEPMMPQLQKELKKIIYSSRQSSQSFYNDHDEYESEDQMEVVVPAY